MRRLSLLARSLPVLALSVLATEARAEWENPPHERTDMAFTEENVPKGWTLVPEEKAPRELRDEVDAAAKEAGLPAAEVAVLLQGLKSPSNVVVPIALVDVYQEPTKVVAALKARAAKGGFALRELASPARLLLVGGPAETREEVAKLHVQAAARALARRAFSENDTENATALARISLALESGAALPRLVLASADYNEAARDAATRGKVVAEFKAALSESATPPLEPTERALARGLLGGLLLHVKTPEADAEGRDLLKQAVESPGDLSKQKLAEFRYNLACAHGRLKELDAAFTNLKAVLEVDRTSKVEGIQHWRKDEDFTNLKSDPRWQEILKEFGESDQTSRE